MKKILDVFLGILTAMGGFVEIGELTFAMNGGSRFDTSLLWVVLIGTLGIIVYCEMAGRVAAVRKQPVFNLIRERVGLDLGLLTLVAALAVSVLTCAAEIGAIALLWQLATGLPYRALIIVALLFFVVVVWFLSFEAIERVFGLLGLSMIVFIVAALKMQPDWHTVAQGLVPQLPQLSSRHEGVVYAFFVVSLLSSIMLPYETYFYASGAIEDKWKPSDITLNRVVVIVGFSLGALLCVALVLVGAQYLGPRAIEGELPGTAALAAASELGKAGLVIALIGMFFAFAGAAIENALTTAYNLAQYFGWPWGKFQPARVASRFTLAWVGALVLATLIVLSGVDPVQLVEVSIVFAIVILPLTYFPMLLIARDKQVMGEHVNGPVAAVLGWSYLAILIVAALAAIPLFIATHGGQG